MHLKVSSRSGLELLNCCVFCFHLLPSLLLLSQRPPAVSTMVLRLHESDLADLAEYTRSYLAENIENMAVEPFAHRVHHKLATGALELENISLLHFSPPSINYRPTTPGLLYIDTDGGRAELVADWRFYSQFLQALGLPLAGRANGQISGFASDIVVETPHNRLVMRQCVARFDRFDLQLSGSLAADILHWFHRVLAKATQSRVEQAYCRIIEERLLPWLLDQLGKLPKRLRMRFSSRVHFSQVLHSIRPGTGYVDLELRSGGNITSVVGSTADRVVPTRGTLTLEERRPAVVYPVTALPPSTGRFVKPGGSGNDEDFVIDREEEDTDGNENVSGHDLSKEDESELPSTPSNVIRLAASQRSQLQLHNQHRAIFHRPERIINSG